MIIRIPVLLSVVALAASSSWTAPANAYQHPLPPPLQRTVPVDDARDFRELERLALAEVPYIKKMEMRDLLLKVDGFDQQGMKIKIYMDRRTGHVLSRELKYDKHGPFGKHGWQSFHGRQGPYPMALPPASMRGTQDVPPAGYP